MRLKTDSTPLSSCCCGAASGAVAGSIVATGRDFISTVVSASGCWEGVG